ncbi:hypothetical protein NDU88_003111 [Pleurodeles waltl]|uniref:Uncharacterized protein n=1 Tax=Pleurodeles waltl TaxID=8319 RepID=A0AAV7NHB3_PLEWA|nr:hypothetical protein NDU88_003111 [Pleurodeles waltl]
MEGEQQLESAPLEDWPLPDPRPDISPTYSKLMNNSPDPLRVLREAWEGDTGVLDDWVEALQNLREIGMRACFRLMQLRILHREYYSLPLGAMIL